MLDRLRQLRHVVLDMDGTIHLGGRVFDYTPPFLALLGEMAIGYTFVTNNNTRSAAEYAARLEEMGIDADADTVYTSARATIEYLQEQRPSVRRLFVLGTASLCRELASAGFLMAGDAPGDEPDAVVVGFDTSLRYERLCRAAWWISRGKPFVATHPDRVCPTNEPTVLPDCGSICACLSHATGRDPDVVLGKPDPRIVEGVMRRHGFRASQVAVVGDRLYTDMKMARHSGALAVLVLSGETTPEEAEADPAAADLVVRDLAEFGRVLKRARETREPGQS